MTPIKDRSKLFKQNDPIAQAIFSAAQGQIDGFVQLLDGIAKQAADSSKLSSWYLTSLAQGFAGLRRGYNESEDNLRAELLALTQRQSAAKWNTQAAGRAYLSYFYPTATIYSDIPALNNNLVVNGNFEQELGSEWQVQGAAVYGPANGYTSFNGNASLALAPGGNAEQGVLLEAGNYALRFAHWGGEIEASIRTASNYWNPKAMQANGLWQGAWQAQQHLYSYPAVAGWQLYTLFFTLETEQKVYVKIEAPGGEPIATANLAAAGTPEYRSAYIDNSYHNTDGTGNVASNQLAEVRAIIDDIRIGTCHSPSLAYTVRLPGTGHEVFSDVLNIYEGTAGTDTAAYIDNTYLDGPSDLSTAQQRKAWLSIIAAAGVHTEIEIITGFNKEAL